MNQRNEPMTPPSPPQSAEGAYREAQAAIRRIEAIYRRGWTVVGTRDALTALDACIRALLAERGHVAKCQCHPAGPCTPRCILNHPRYDDNRCARPAWLPESK